MTSTLLVLLGCSFVEPAEPPVELDPPQPVLDRIDALRERLQATDGGAELWRSIDTHGGLLRYERVGPWTAHLADGRIVDPDAPLHDALTRPFSLADVTVAPGGPTDAGQLAVRTANGEAVHLDPTDRHLLRCPVATRSTRSSPPVRSRASR